MHFTFLMRNPWTVYNWTLRKSVLLEIHGQRWLKGRDSLMGRRRTRTISFEQIFDSICWDPGTVDLVRISKGGKGIHGRPNWSNFLRGN